MYYFQIEHTQLNKLLICKNPELYRALRHIAMVTVTDKAGFVEGLAGNSIKGKRLKIDLSAALG